jgi:hypothetical protein
LLRGPRHFSQEISALLAILPSHLVAMQGAWPLPGAPLLLDSSLSLNLFLGPNPTSACRFTSTGACPRFFVNPGGRRAISIASAIRAQYLSQVPFVAFKLQAEWRTFAVSLASRSLSHITVCPKRSSDPRFFPGGHLNSRVPSFCSLIGTVRMIRMHPTAQNVGIFSPYSNPLLLLLQAQWRTVRICNDLGFKEPLMQKPLVRLEPGPLIFCSRFHYSQVPVAHGPHLHRVRQHLLQWKPTNRIRLSTRRFSQGR